VTVLALAVTGAGARRSDRARHPGRRRGLLRGRAAFETLRVYSGRPFSLEAHLDRLTASAASIGLPAVERRRLQVLVGLVLPKGGRRRRVLRLVWTAGPTGGIPSALALLSTVPEWIEETRERGATAVSLLGVRASAPWLLPGVKSTSYAVNMAARPRPDVVVSTRRSSSTRRNRPRGDGDERPGGASARGSTRPASTSGSSPAYPRGADPARARVRVPGGGGGYPLTQLIAAEEAFTSSSVREVMPLVEIDGQALGRGPAGDAAPGGAA
jgi:4-amino-4-deoxychorismate lyase